MNTNRLSVIGCVLTAMALGSPNALAARQKPVAKETAVREVELTGAGQKLLARYADQLKALQAEIPEVLPRIAEPKKAGFLKAFEAETAAAAAAQAAQKAASNKRAKNKEELAKIHQAAEEALVEAQTHAQQAAKAMLAEVEPFLASDKLDARLVKAAVLVSATPRGLAEFAQQGKEEEALIDMLLRDDALLKQMLIAGGAKYGQYGQAMKIYMGIMKSTDKAGEGLFQRLALATALEHAMPIAQNNPNDRPDAPVFVNPVSRYLHYQKAFLDGELDPAFKDLTVWEYRMVVSCDAPDEILAWGREMLRNYRPDHIRTDNQGWRYSILVKTDVLYGSGDVKKDLTSLQQYQNIVLNGGVCGRRAFFGRFILRSFGIPVWGVTQRGHAALGRWTPGGWVVNLGAAFKWSWWDKDEAPRGGADFLLESQARELPQDYLKVLRARWIGDVLGEEDYNDRRAIAGGFWSALAHHETQAIAIASKAVELGPVGQDVAESNESKEVHKAEAARMSEADRQVVVGPDGVITIPAVAISMPEGNTAQIISMKSFPDGMQLVCARDMKADLHFEYTFDAPQAGKYALTAHVVTVQSDQKLLVAANDAEASVEIALPYTLGRWQQSEPVGITLTKGRNVLKFTRPAPGRGVSIKDFSLKPQK